MMSKSVTFTEPDLFFKQPTVASVAEAAGFRVIPQSDAPEIRQPEDFSGLGAAKHGCRLRVNPSDLIIGEAPLLNEAEQADAQEALIADQIFTSPDWPAHYLDRDFPSHEGQAIRFEAPALITIGIKFGWALEQAARIAAAARRESPRFERLEIVIDSPATVTPEEHLFIGLELHRRGVGAFDLILPWGGRWEPAVDWIGDAETFASGLATHHAVAVQNGEWGLGFDHAEEKFTVLPILSAQCGDRLHLNIDGVAWTEAMRVLTRCEPTLLRELLPIAQDRFAFDKPDAELATTEDDIRSLPDVPDSELERVFVEDFRGRQLLRFTAASLLSHEQYGPAIRAAIERNRQEHAELVRAQVARHFAPRAARDGTIAENRRV